MPTWLPWIYSLCAALYIGLAASGEFTGSFLVKIVPLLLLASQLWLLARREQVVPVSWRWLAVGLSFGMLGDVLLAWDGQRLFVFGLAAFLVGHLGYIMALRPFQALRPWLLLPYAGFAGVVLSLMWPQLGALALPVLVYIGVILAMSVATWHAQPSNGALKLGALFFIVSDALIGLNKFWQPIAGAGSAIMLTYYIAQYLLVTGLLARHKHGNDTTAV